MTPSHSIRPDDVLRVAIVLVAIGVWMPLTARADADAYAREKRVAHLAAAIDGMTAMGDAGRRAFEVAIYEAVRTKCRPQSRAAPIACATTAARDVCAGQTGAKGAGAKGAGATGVGAKGAGRVDGADTAAEARTAIAAAGDRCLAVADVIITNQRAEKTMLDETTRMRLVGAAADYHLAVIAALEARWAVLAAELSLSSPTAPMAERIDQMCRERDREVRPCGAAEATGMTPKSGGAPVCVGTIAYQRCAAGLVWFTSGPRSKP